MVDWDIDPAASFIRLNIPESVLDVIGNDVTLRFRDAGNNSLWTDAGGRRAFLDGTIKTDYVDGGSIAFVPGTYIAALEQTSLRPNPAAFSPLTTDTSNPDGVYSDSSAALAAFGAKVRASFSVITSDAAFLALRDVQFDLSSGVVPLIGGNTIAANSTAFGIASAQVDIDAMSVLILGQIIPDTHNQPLMLANQMNLAGGSVVPLGAYVRRLTLNVNIPMTINLGAASLPASATGQIVAYMMVPEPSTFALLAVGASAAVVAGYRRPVHRRQRG